MQSLITEWCTSQINKSDRYDAWNVMLNRTYGRWTPDNSDTKDFFGKVKSFNSDALRIVDCICDPCGATRTSSSIRSDGIETITIQYVIDGSESINLNDEQIMLNRNDILVWDSTRPMSFQVHNRLHKISVVLPLDRFRSWCPKNGFSFRNSIDGFSSNGKLLGNHVKSLSSSVFKGGCKNNFALVDATIGMLINALEIRKGRGDNRAMQLGKLDNIKSFIAINIQDPDLSPTSIAKSVGMSLRYLHKLFEMTDESVSQYIINQRLRQCARDISNPQMSGRQISEIAYSWGFQDVAHFNKRFKKQYLMTPLEYRHHRTDGLLFKNSSV